MKKFWLGLGILIVLVIIVGIGVGKWWVGTYNSLVHKDEAVKQSWGEVQTQYQRRIDMLPNLAETVKGYAAHESKVFEGVARARSQVVALNVDAATLASNPDIQKQFVQAQQQLTSSLTQMLTQLRVTIESNPTLKADQGFLKLQDQIEGTENRIKNERSNNQAAVNDYNVFVKGFWTSFVANHYDFHVRPYFEADADAQKAPKIGF